MNRKNFKLYLTLTVYVGIFSENFLISDLIFKFLLFTYILNKISKFNTHLFILQGNISHFSRVIIAQI
jgi:hypothetical protein